MFRPIELRNIFTPKFVTQQWIKQRFLNRSKFQFKRFQSIITNTTTKNKQTGIKALVSKYGYSALGIYLALSCIDFPLSFLVVHQVGAEKVKQVQHDAFVTVKSWFGIKEKEPVVASQDTETHDHFELNHEHATEPLPPTEQTMWESIYSSPLFTEIIVAYALHKSLVFIRVPLTAAITPPIVSKLRSMGFQIGKQKLTSTFSNAAAKSKYGGLAADKVINEKFGTKATKKQRWWSWFF